MALPSSRAPLVHTTDEWDAYKPYIEEHYMTGNKPLKDVMKIMKDVYGFEASVKAYKRRFDMWHWDKNVTRSRLAEVLRGNTVQHSDFTGIVKNGPRKRVIPPSSIQRYCERNNINIEQFLQTQKLWDLQHSTTSLQLSSPHTSPRLFLPAHTRAYQSVIFHSGEHMRQSFSNILPAGAPRPRGTASKDLRRGQLMASVSIITSCYSRGETQTGLLHSLKALSSIVDLADSPYTDTILAIFEFLVAFGDEHEALARAFCFQITRIARRKCNTPSLIYRVLAELAGMDLSEVRRLLEQIGDKQVVVLGEHLSSSNGREHHALEVHRVMLQHQRGMITDAIVWWWIDRLDMTYGRAYWGSIYLLHRLSLHHQNIENHEHARAICENLVERTVGVENLFMGIVKKALECKLYLACCKIYFDKDAVEGTLMLEDCLAAFINLEAMYEENAFSGKILCIIDYLINVADEIGDTERAGFWYDRKIEVLCQMSPPNVNEGDITVMRDALENLSTTEKGDQWIASIL